MTVNGGRWLKPRAIVAHLHDQPLAFDAKVQFDPCAICMLDDVVDALLKNQKYLTSHVCSDKDVVLAVRSVETKRDIARHKHVSSKSAHSLRQVVKLVLGRVD